LPDIASALHCSLAGWSNFALRWLLNGEQSSPLSNHLAARIRRQILAEQSNFFKVGLLWQ
jgi:hypothetical protein